LIYFFISKMIIAQEQFTLKNLVFGNKFQIIVVHYHSVKSKKLPSLPPE
jgi:hypothetical protein